jgi:hypothetical protein
VTKVFFGFFSRTGLPLVDFVALSVLAGMAEGGKGRKDDVTIVCF